MNSVNPEIRIRALESGPETRVEELVLRSAVDPSRQTAGPLTGRANRAHETRRVNHTQLPPPVLVGAR